MEDYMKSEQTLSLKMGMQALIYTSIIATGVILPYLTHLIGGQAAGMIFLPLHLVILTAGLLFGWEMGGFVGITLPVISFFLSGMPPLPVLPQMIFELGIYGTLSGFFYKKLKWNIFLSLLLSIVAGRFFLILYFTFLKNNFQSLWHQMQLGIPGVLLQIVLIPFFLKLGHLAKPTNTNYKHK